MLKKEQLIFVKPSLEWEQAAKTVHDNWVVASTFFAVRKSDNKIIGMVDIRHSLNDFLANYGGHIGYGVRPTEFKHESIHTDGKTVQVFWISLDSISLDAL